jgi:hypothetical protein
VVLPTGSAIRSLAHWQENLGRGLHLEGGQIRHFDHEPGRHTYLAADLTRAYNTPGHDEGGRGGKVTRVERELLYLLEEDRLVVRDRVVSTRPELTKKWLLHTVSRPQAEGLRVLRGTEGNGILEAPAGPIRIANGRGRLRVDPVLPEDGRVRLVGGPDHRFYVETDGDDSDLDGRNFAEGASPEPWFDQAHWRIELQPGAARAAEEFLVALTPSLDRTRDEPVTRVTVSGGAAVGLATPTSVVLFLNDQDRSPLTADLPAGVQTLYVLGLPPLEPVTLTAGGVPRTVIANEAGVLRTDMSGEGTRLDLRLGKP